MDFTFIHAADIHLDSALDGLSRRDERFHALVTGATRRALINVVDLAIAEDAKFVVIAGDLYDGTWRDQSTGQFAVAQFARLTRAGIRVVVAFGNHDAQSRVTKHLTATDGVWMLNNSRCETVFLDELRVAIHGRSYKDAATTENLANTYCEAEKGYFNIAVLHTALGGHAAHANYAPCTLDELTAASHDYWALGHVHEFSIRAEAPHVVFPGNTQGRSVRETGAKGAVVVRVADERVIAAEHRACDEVRWAVAVVDGAGAADRREALASVTVALRDAARAAEGRPLAVRVAFDTRPALARALQADRSFEAEVRAHAEAVRDDIWIERVRLRATGAEGSLALPPEFAELLDAAAGDADCRRAVEEVVEPLTAKLPEDVGADDTTPLLKAARVRDTAGLFAAARALIEARLAAAD